VRSLTDNQQTLIADSIELESGHRVVLLDIAGKHGFAATDVNRNVYCIGPGGQIIWQVAPDGIIYDQDSFVSLRRLPGGFIHAHRFFGNEFSLDPSNGKLTQTGWSK
jgi:hypothetical protein